MRDFVADRSDDAYERLVDQLLASPHYGERWGRRWLDVVGYSDSNGYMRHDTPRPLAYRYRDYVISSVNEDKPYDQFWIEQLAGDELVDYHGTERLSPREWETLIATHFLRNAPDGTDSTEGNETTRVMERYAVLEQLQQITVSAMFGLTIDCARCHSHKFDPIPHRDYYALQAIFYPAFNVKDWIQPYDRWIHLAAKETIAEWEATNKRLDEEVVQLQQDFEQSLSGERPAGDVTFEDDFASVSLTDRWSPLAPGDNGPSEHSTVPFDTVQFDTATPPAALVADQQLQLLAASSSNNVWLSTGQAFDWTPDVVGGWIQVTFDLITSAERVGYYVALHDYDDNGEVTGGNLLIDGSPDGEAELFLDSPGEDQQPVGVIGSAGYQPGHNYGVRITHLGEDKHLVQHLLDGHVDGKSVTLAGEQLPDGGFGFEMRLSRSFIVDNVRIESTTAADGNAEKAAALEQFSRQVVAKQETLAKEIEAKQQARIAEPEKIAWATDLSREVPPVSILERGDYFHPGDFVEPGPLSVLADADNTWEVTPPRPDAKTTGRRLAFARWATRPGSRAASLLARVEVDRIWAGHFGQHLVPTPENFGASGSPPTSPRLLEWLAVEFAENGWSRKHLHRQILLSRAYRQASTADKDAGRNDWCRFPSHRLEAEIIRDAMLAAAGVIHLKMGGPAVPFEDRDRQIVVPIPQGDGPHEAYRRSIYIQHRRSQPLTFLKMFDLASPEPNCLARATSTVVSQSLAMLNSEFAVRMGERFAERLQCEASMDPRRQVQHAFEVALARPPEPNELQRSLDFLQNHALLRQQAGASTEHEATSEGEAAGKGEAAGEREAVGEGEAGQAALADFCRMLLATNEFSYIQ